MQCRKLTCVFLFLASTIGVVEARAKVTEDANGSLKTITTIGDALNSPDHHPVHVLYIHGIGQTSAGNSALLRNSICTRLRLCAAGDWKNAGVEFADKGEFSPSVQPPTLQYLGEPVWRNEAEWQAAAPFVVHWVVHLRKFPAPLVLDEINWWPLTLSLKCRQLLAPEARLAGPNRDLLALCSQPARQSPDGSGRFYPWITAGEAAKLDAMRPHAVLLNRTLKQSLIDWELEDIILATGPMSGILRDGVRQLMAKSAAFDPRAADFGSAASGAQDKYDWRLHLNGDKVLDQEFIGVAHSLGSYLLFNALSVNSPGAAPGQTGRSEETLRLAAEQDAVRYIFERTSQVYCFANQLAPLEVTNLENGPPAATGGFTSRGLAPPPEISTAPAANLQSLVNLWQRLQNSFQATLHPDSPGARRSVQLVAFSDPSDLLTFRVPRIGNVEVVNVYVKVAPHWLGLVESPYAAHDDYAENEEVLRLMFETPAHRGGQ